MQRSALNKIGRPLLHIGLPGVILALFLSQVKNDWNQLTAHAFQWNPWLLALTFLGFMLQELSYGFIWRAALMRLGSRLDLRIYLASEFVRYIPGNVWQVLTRLLWVGKYGVSRTVALASMAIELITKLAGVLVFAASLLFWYGFGAGGSLLHGTLIDVLGGATILALCILLHPRILGGPLNLALRLLKRNPVQLSLRYSDILIVTLAWCVSWITAGSAFYVLLLALCPTAPLVVLPICIGVYALAWDIGFVSIITRGGFVFREGAIVGLFALSLPLPTALAPLIAILSRLVSTIAELVCVGIALLRGGRQVRNIQQEQIAQPRSINEHTQGKDMREISFETSIGAPVKGGGGSE